jgi:hypothetical protein
MERQQSGNSSFSSGSDIQDFEYSSKVRRSSAVTGSVAPALSQGTGNVQSPGEGVIPPEDQ